MFHDPDGCRDDGVRSHKVGSMEQTKTNTKIAGVDVGKAHLDAAVHGMEDLTRVGNAPAGFSELIAWLKAREVGRVGLEATGGYERAARLALEAMAFLKKGEDCEVAFKKFVCNLYVPQALPAVLFCNNLNRYHPQCTYGFVEQLCYSVCADAMSSCGAGKAQTAYTSHP